MIIGAFIAQFGVLGVVLAWLFARHRRGLRARADAGPAVVPDGVMIPVSRIFHCSGGPLHGVVNNSINPTFCILGDGIHFRAFGSRQLPFTDLAHIELRKNSNGATLLFVGRKWGQVLVAEIRGDANVLAALRAVPDGIAMTIEAALVRDGNPAGATQDLRLYRGRTR